MEAIFEPKSRTVYSFIGLGGQLCGNAATEVRNRNRWGRVCAAMWFRGGR